MVPGFNADAWTIAKPLVLYITAPLALGIAVRRASERTAEAAHPLVRRVTAAATVTMLGVIAWMYGADFLAAVGTYAIATQFIFYPVVALGAPCEPGVAETWTANFGGRPFRFAPPKGFKAFDAAAK